MNLKRKKDSILMGKTLKEKLYDRFSKKSDEMKEEKKIILNLTLNVSLTSGEYAKLMKLLDNAEVVSSDSNYSYSRNRSSDSSIFSEPVNYWLNGGSK
jgi:hypothetical protein